MFLQFRCKFQPSPSDSDKRVWNRHLILDNQGQTVAEYDKLHLFDIDIPGKVRLFVNYDMDITYVIYKYKTFS